MQHALRQRNPCANPEVYIGHERHYALAAAEAGVEFHRKGKPAQKSLDRALPGQVATVLNMLNFVWDVSELVRVGLLERSFSFRALKAVQTRSALQDPRYECLQDQYAALIGHLKSARRFRLISFDGQIEPMWSDGKLLTVEATELSRAQLLEVIRREENLPLIAESNLDRLRAYLLRDGDAGRICAEPPNADGDDGHGDREAESSGSDGGDNTDSDSDSREADRLGAQIRAMMRGFLRNDETAVKAAMKTM
jgi:hypothetical protein